MRLSQNFTLAELTITHTGLPNTPNREQTANLRTLCQRILQPLRDSLGRPIIVTSGFRAPAVNRAVGGSSTSDHRTGLAADIKTAGFNSYQLAEFVIGMGLPFDQLIQYPGSDRIHVSCRPAPRGQVLHKTRSGYGQGLRA